MKSGSSVVYIGPETIFQGVRGVLVDAPDPATRRARLHFQPESRGIRAVPCEIQDVQAVESQLAES